jgi:hypothetical protein
LRRLSERVALGVPEALKVHASRPRVSLTVRVDSVEALTAHIESNSVTRSPRESNRNPSTEPGQLQSHASDEEVAAT